MSTPRTNGGRRLEAALEALGWRRRDASPDARWIRLVCEHSGMFVRAHYCFHRRCHRSTALRLVRRLVERGVAREHPMPREAPGRRLCHIFAKSLYRALGIPDVRHRRFPADSALTWRRLLSLDAVIEDPDRAWLPGEADKVRYCEERGVPAEALPRKDYRNPATGATTTRFFSPWKLPLAGSPDRATFVYADPGRDTVSELASWTAEHTRLWSSLRDAGVLVDVLVIARTVQGVDRASRWLDAKTAHLDLFEPEEQERFQRLDRALRSRDPELLQAEGGLMAVVRAHGALMRSRRARATPPIDRFAARVAIRVAGDGYAA